MLQINAPGRLNVSPDEIALMAAQFAKRQVLKLPGFTEKSILDRIMKYVDTTDFVPACYFDTNTNRELAKEITNSPDNSAVNMLTMLLNNPDLHRILETITGTPVLVSALGRLSRMTPNSELHISWHNDNPDGSRLIGISINLSHATFSGGVFQLRDKTSERILGEVVNNVAGDAVIFRISKNFEHQVTPLEGTNSRTCFIGSFYSEPHFQDRLRIAKKDGPDLARNAGSGSN